jgi:hypothetical protein
MLEAILSSELYSVVCLILPWIVAIAGAIGTACVSIYKVGQVINEFRGSNELKEYNKRMGEYIKKQTSTEAKLDKIEQMLSNKHAPGWTDDKEG